MRMLAEDHDSEFYYVIDKDTGNRIEYCTMADDVSGEYEVQTRDADGNPIIDYALGAVKMEKRTGNIQLVDTRIASQALE